MAARLNSLISLKYFAVFFLVRYKAFIFGFIQKTNFLRYQKNRFRKFSTSQLFFGNPNLIIFNFTHKIKFYFNLGQSHFFRKKIHCLWIGLFFFKITNKKLFKHFFQYLNRFCHFRLVFQLIKLFAHRHNHKIV